MNAKGLSIVNLEKVYPNNHGKDVHAVDNISMEIEPGEFVNFDLGPGAVVDGIRLIAAAQVQEGGTGK